MNRYSESARLTFHFAWTEADSLGANVVGIEHLLLGLLRQQTTASRALKDAGVTLDDARQKVGQRTGRATSKLSETPTPELEELMRVAEFSTRTRRDSSIKPKDLLLTMLELYGASLQNLVEDTDALRRKLSLEEA